MLGFFALICAVSLTIAIAFAWFGAWMILPFAGAELLLLGACLYRVGLKNRDCEVISIRDGVVEIQRGRNHPTVIARFVRGWTRLEIAPPHRYGDERRLLLRCHGRREEVGRCLNGTERAHLARELERRLGTALAA